MITLTEDAAEKRTADLHEQAVQSRVELRDWANQLGRLLDQIERWSTAHVDADDDDADRREGELP